MPLGLAKVDVKRIVLIFDLGGGLYLSLLFKIELLASSLQLRIPPRVN